MKCLGSAMTAYVIKWPPIPLDTRAVSGEALVRDELDAARVGLSVLKNT
jgi:hypothetical protein